MEAKGRKGGRLVGALGIEPRTNGLKGRCSTIELRTRTQQNVVYQTLSDINNVACHTFLAKQDAAP